MCQNTLFLIFLFFGGLNLLITFFSVEIILTDPRFSIIALELNK
jgi:hypothetical protein